MEITNATFTSPGWSYYKFPFSLSPIPGSMKNGIIALCTFALLSCIATLSLLGYLTYRFITERNGRRSPLHKNQYMLLIYSLLLADLQCDLGFFLDVQWLYHNQILAPSAGCYVQAWLINFGDLGSACFVFAIACHTFINVVFGYRTSLRSVCIAIVTLWILAAVISLVPVAMHPKDIFTTVGNWCSISSKYNPYRLWFHYLWVFIAEALVIIMYLTTFIVVRRRLATVMSQLGHHPNTGSGTGVRNKSTLTAQTKVSRATMYMILYPLIYVLTTLPLAAGRISAMVGKPPTLKYLIVSGTFMSCGGFCNVVLYSASRRIFLKENRDGSGEGTGLSAYGRNRGEGDIELSKSRRQPSSNYLELPSPATSTEYIVGRTDELKASNMKNKEAVTMETTWEVQIEEVKPTAKLPDTSKFGYRTYVS
ncbi:G protein-coupled glucose receptor regulating Gpa2-domain-containing protein [Bisporella sp. PMI_857]|nr:G protein-coupled glucose receptor regulating Gpa2-domain-containing protein [Bisporella sp. PMI_857]